MNMCCLVGFTCGYVNIVEEIINNRKDINAKSENGGILLHLACKDNNDEIVSILRID
jgi:ankyrin repeat protein